MRDTTEATVEGLRELEQRYAGGAERPIGSYAVLMAGYVCVTLALTLIGRRRRARLPEGLGAGDLVLLSTAVYRSSRLITKDSVTAFARAPFTRFEEAAGEGEVNEEVIGRGPAHAVGELITCPFCISVWLATFGMFGMIVFPRATRMICSALTAVAASDLMQFGHSMLDRAAG